MPQGPQAGITESISITAVMDTELDGLIVTDQTGVIKSFNPSAIRIFKRNDEDKATNGIGVGPAFVKMIIERHNGPIWLESETSKSTTFYFTIPQGDENEYS